MGTFLQAEEEAKVKEKAEKEARSKLSSAAGRIW